MYKSIQKTVNLAAFLSFVAVPCFAGATTLPLDPQNQKDYYTVNQIEIEEYEGEEMLLAAPIRTQVVPIDWDIGVPNPNPAPAPGQYPGQPYPGQTYPGQQYPGQPYPGQSYPGNPSPWTLPNPAPTPTPFNPAPTPFPPQGPTPGPSATPVPGFTQPPSNGGYYPYETYPPAYSPVPPLTGTGWDLGSMMAFGKSIWDIIVANKPVVNIRTDKIDVLPEGSRGWTDLQGWNPPKIRSYKIVFRNVLAMPIVNVSYRVMYTNGGNKNGKGKFLSNVTVVPTDIWVFWGFDFGMVASIANVTNAGSSLDPMSAVELLVQWKLSTPLVYRQGAYSYYVRGDGYYQNL